MARPFPLTASHIGKNGYKIISTIKNQTNTVYRYQFSFFALRFIILLQQLAWLDFDG
jgi:hypothetical protein